MPDHHVPALLPWQVELLHEITTLCQENLKKWMNVIHKLGVPEAVRSEWSNTYRNELETLLTDMCQDVEDRELVTRNRINLMKSKAAELALQLAVPCMSFTTEPCMYLEEQQLKSYLAKLEENLEVRKKEISELQERQEKICTMLSKACMPFSDTPLPSPEEITVVREYVKSMENECFLREEHFCTMQNELKQLAVDYDYRPQNDYERRICNAGKEEDSFVDVTDKGMAALNKLHDEIRKHAEVCRGEKHLLLDKIAALWKMLEENPEETEKFLALHKGATLSDINACKEEFRRLDALKRANLKTLVSRMREKLFELWDKCLCDEAVRNEFLMFHDDSPTETVLQIYEHEVDRWTRHFNDNEPFFDTITKFKDAAKKMNELDAPAEGNKRFKNRGGQLLQEEKERKMSKKRIEKLEAALIQYAHEYKLNYGKEFQIDGFNIEEFINHHYIGSEENKIARAKLTPGVVKTLNIPTNSAIQSKKSPSTMKKLPSGTQGSFSKASTSKSRNPIKSGAKKLFTNSIPNLKKMAEIANRDRDQMLKVCTFKDIIDTTMPSMIQNHSQIFCACLPEDEEDKDAVSLPPSPSEQSSTFSNITMRRKKRDDYDDDDDY